MKTELEQRLNELIEIGIIYKNEDKKIVEEHFLEFEKQKQKSDYMNFIESFVKIIDKPAFGDIESRKYFYSQLGNYNLNDWRSVMTNVMKDSKLKQGGEYAKFVSPEYITNPKKVLNNQSVAEIYLNYSQVKNTNNEPTQNIEADYKRDIQL